MPDQIDAAADRATADRPDPAADEMKEVEVLSSLSLALQHIAAELSELRQAIETITQKYGHIYAINKRIEAALTRVEKILTEDNDPNA
jgi:hypothetical protein